MNISRQLTLFHTANIAYPTDSEYDILKAVAQEKYLKTYKAKTNPNPDLFVYTNLSDNMNNFSGACFGLTFASNNKLFSEKYLDKPIEKILQKNHNINISRSNIAELSSLTSVNSSGEGQFLIRSLPSVLKNFNLDALLVTSTEQLRGIYEKKGIKFHKITQALKSKIETDLANDWGTYYDSNPITGFVLAHEHSYSIPVNETPSEQHSKVAINLT